MSFVDRYFFNCTLYVLDELHRPLTGWFSHLIQQESNYMGKPLFAVPECNINLWCTNHHIDIQQLPEEKQISH